MLSVVENDGSSNKPFVVWIDGLDRSQSQDEESVFRILVDPRTENDVASIWRHVQTRTFIELHAGDSLQCLPILWQDEHIPLSGHRASCAPKTH